MIEALKAGIARLRLQGTKRARSQSAKYEFIIAAAESDTDECILWPWAKTEDGYGVLGFQGHIWTAHALVLTLKACPRPSPQHQAGHVEHKKCGNRACCNPRHLAGWQLPLDQTRNKRDDETWGRRFTDEMLEAIQRDKRPLRIIAEEYGVSPSQIRIIKNQRYKQAARRRRRPSNLPRKMRGHR